MTFAAKIVIKCLSKTIYRKIYATFIPLFILLRILNMDNSSKRVFLLDAYALIYRAYFAFINNHRYSSKGVNTSAMIGFANTLEELIDKEAPTHIAVAFDLHAPTFRHNIYSEYKANRDSMPEEMRVAIPYIRQIIEAYNIPILELEGYEADDIIGTLSHKLTASSDDVMVYMVTPDKDYAQLVTKQVLQYKPRRGDRPVEIWDVEKVNSSFNISEPKQVVDILGLMGDSSDNIPGCPGVGPKGAQKLIGLYSSVEGIYENIDKLKGKQKEKFIDNEEQVRLSKVLAQIILDVPIDSDIDKMELGLPNIESLVKLFNELELRRNLNRIKDRFPEAYAEFEGREIAALNQKAKSSSGTDSKLESTVKIQSKAEPKVKIESNGGEMEFEAGTLFGPPLEPKRDEDLPESTINKFVDKSVSSLFEDVDTITDPSGLQTLDSYQHRFVIVDSKEERGNLIADLFKQSCFCFDTETTSLVSTKAELVGIAFTYRDREAYYVPIPADKRGAQSVVDEFSELFRSESVGKVGQNLKYDIVVLSNYGIEVRGDMFDTMLAHYLIEPEQRHNLDSMSEQYLNFKKITTESLIGKKGKKQLSMRDIDTATVAKYAGEDVECTWRLSSILEQDIESRGLTKLLKDIEMPLMKVLCDIEIHGVTIDQWALQAFSTELNISIEKIERSVFEMAGEKFNLASPKQLGLILFDKLQLNTKAKKTKSGQYSTGEEILVKLKDKHPIVELILEFRAQKKLLTTYVDALPLLINSRTGNIHTSFNQAVVATGRLSSTNPNLQNIPIRREMGKQIRKAFIASDSDHIFLSADYSQVELRLMAALSGDKAMIEAFNKGVDIHSTTASKVFGIPIDEVTPEMRGRAKGVNFGIIYGISAHGLSQNIGVSRKEAKQIIDDYFENFPEVKNFMDRSIEVAREKGYVETIYGRKRYLNDIDSANAMTRGFAERNAINAPIQGSAADIIKIAMINISKRMKDENLKSKMILQVHDELNFDVPKEEIDIMRRVVKEEMEGAVELSVPLTVDVGSGQNWLDAH